MTERCSPSLSTKRTRLNDAARHLSKSASELNGRECSVDVADSPSGSPQRAKSAANPSVAGVIQRTHGFFSTLKNKWSRARSKERLGRKSPNDFLEHQESTDYAADYSSDNSTSANSPRHRATTMSSLARGVKISTESVTDQVLEYGDSNQGHDSGGPSDNTLNLLAMEEQKRKKEAQLRQYVFFQLRIHLKAGTNLVAMDKSGTSDPYVKFKISGRLLHKTKTIHRDLNPNWDEIFVVPIEDPFEPIIIKVFDYDWGLQDDFMGSAKLDLTQLELGKAEELRICLEDETRHTKDLGELILTATLWPRSQEDKELHFQRSSKLSEASKRMKSQIWSSVVTILLVKAKQLPLGEDGNKLSDAHIKFRLGNEKYKSKTSWTERWVEQFDLHLFDEEQNLEISLWNRNNLYGKANINLSTLARETTQSIWQQFEDCTGEVLLMVTISGTTSLETISDLKSYREDSREIKAVTERYQWHKSHQHLRDIGHLTVKVFGATGLAAADIGGKSDPFCVIELVNARLQTQTEYKTLTPNWNKIFTFNVKDITSVLELTVYDEDRDHKVEFLGKVIIPLLRIKNGVKRWYTLKDKNVISRAKGLSPQILLELTVIWNPIRASIRVIMPKEEKLIQQEAKFKRQLFLRNVARFKAIAKELYSAHRYFHSCFEWEYPVRSVIAFSLWILACLYGNLETILPMILLVIIMKNWFVRWITGASSESSGLNYDYDDDDDDDDKEKEGKKSIKERLHAIQEVSQTVQNIIGYLASLGESTKNALNFSVPELTWLAFILLFAICLILYLIPFRIILLIIGIVKFTKRILRPNSVPNNELLDFLSRVPDDEMLHSYREIPPSSAAELLRPNTKKKKNS